MNKPTVVIGLGIVISIIVLTGIIASAITYDKGVSDATFAIEVGQTLQERTAAEQRGIQIGKQNIESFLNIIVAECGGYASMTLTPQGNTIACK